MSKTPEQVSQDIRQRLSITDASISAEIGTPERKIIDAVAEVVSSAYVDSYLTSTMWDIDTKTGVELDQLVGLFGFGRQAGRRATGTIRFTLSSPATVEVFVPMGTLVFVPATDVFTQVNFATTTPGTIPVDSSYCEVAIECTVSGVLGNTTANTIVGSQTMSSMGVVTNPSPTQGGLDPESDDQLRQRFTNTFLRNLSGTEDFYAAICLQSPLVSKVRVIGPIEKYREQLQIGNGVVASGNTFSKFNWPDSSFVSTNLGTESELYYKNNIHYVFDSNTAKPTITPTSNDLKNTIVDLEYEYTPTSSRNDPQKGIQNKVDVFLNGSQQVQAREVRPYVPMQLNNTEGSVWNRNSFKLEDGSIPGTGWLIPLTYQPVVIIPESISHQGVTKRNGVDYQLVKSTTTLRGSTREVSGIFSTTKLFADNSVLTLEYVYNRLPEVLGSMIDQNRQITTDGLVHEANFRYFKINLVMVYHTGFSTESVDMFVKRELTNWMAGLAYGSWIQASDIEAVVHSIGGVDAVRVSNFGDVDLPTGIVEVQKGGSSITTHTQDFRLSDTDLPVLFSVTTKRRSPNTFGG